jgi:hypothetical protein
VDFMKPLWPEFMNVNSIQWCKFWGWCFLCAIESKSFSHNGQIIFFLQFLGWILFLILECVLQFGQNRFKKIDSRTVPSQGAIRQLLHLQLQLCSKLECLTYNEETLWKTHYMCRLFAAL